MKIMDPDLQTKTKNHKRQGLCENLYTSATNQV